MIYLKAFRIVSHRKIFIKELCISNAKTLVEAQDAREKFRVNLKSLGVDFDGIDLIKY